MKAGALTLALLLGVPGPAHALLSACSFSAVNGVSFGAYSPTAGTPLDGVGSFSYSCIAVLGGGSLTISLSTGGSGTYAPRRMSSGAYTLNYNLYLDAARTIVWGDGTGATSVYGPVSLPVILGSVSETRTVYGQIPAGQTGAGVGSYADTVTVTVHF